MSSDFNLILQVLLQASKFVSEKPKIYGVLEPEETAILEQKRRRDEDRELCQGELINLPKCLF